MPLHHWKPARLALAVVCIAFFPAGGIASPATSEDPAHVFGQVRSLAEYRGELFVGGRIHRIGNQAINPHNIMRWDGSRWLELNGGVDFLNDPEANGNRRGGTVLTMLPTVQGLVVGGHFDNAGGIPVSNVAIWNGGDWRELAGGLERPVYSLAEFEGQLYASTGTVDASTYPSVHGIWRYDYPSRWEAVDMPSHYASSHVWKLAVAQGSLFAVGAFYPVEGTGLGSPDHVLRLADGQWQPFDGGPIHGDNPELTRPLYPFSTEGARDLLAVGDDLYLAQAVPGEPGLMVQEGDGWAALPGSGQPTQLHAVGTKLLATGLFLPRLRAGQNASPTLAAWAGESWETLDGLPAIEGANAQLAVAAGEYREGIALAIPVHSSGRETVTAPHAIWTWDGDQFRPLRATRALPSTVKALSSHGGELVAAGNFREAGGTPALGVAAWNGTSWRPLGQGFVPRTQATATLADELNCPLYDLGPREHIDIGEQREEHFYGVASLASFRRSLYAGGYFIAAADSSLRHLARWDGQRWQTAFALQPVDECIDGAVRSLVSSPDELFVLGHFYLEGRGEPSRLVSWDGATARDIDPPAWAGPARDAIGHWDGKNLLYFPGWNADDLPGNGPEPASWDGVNWTALPATPGPVHSVADHAGVLWAQIAADFDPAYPWGGPTALYRLEGQQWVPTAVPSPDGTGPAQFAGPPRLIDLPDGLAVHSARMLHRLGPDGWSHAENPNQPLYYPFAAASFGGDIIIGGRHDNSGLGNQPLDALYWFEGAGSSPAPSYTTSLAANASGVQLQVDLPIVPEPIEVLVERVSADGQRSTVFAGPATSLPQPLLDRPYLPGLYEYRIHASTERADLGTVVETVEWLASPVDRLLPAYPNPFNPQTTLAFELRAPAMVRLEIFNSAGRRVRSLDLGQLGAGPHDTVWDGRDDGGATVASGSYLVRMSASGQVDEQRVLLLK